MSPTSSGLASSRLGKALLSGCTTDQRLLDLVLGDLEEEWHERTLGKNKGQSTSGLMPARVWFWQQCVRSAPHLIADWWHRASSRDAARRGALVLVVFGLLGLACIGLHNYQIWLADFMIGLLSASLEGAEPITKNWDSIALGALLGSAGWGLVGGFGLVMIVRRAPLISLTLLAGVWFPAAIGLPLLLPGEWPVWAFVVFPFLMSTSVLLGGLIGTTLWFYFYALAQRLDFSLIAGNKRR